MKGKNLKKRILSLKIIIFFYLLLNLVCIAPAKASQQAQEKLPSLPSFRSEVIKLKYKKAEDIRPLLYGFLSTYGRIFVSEKMNDVLTISDLPENVEKILNFIKEIDTKPADFLFTVQVILASRESEVIDAEIQNDPIIKELRQLLKYTGFTLIDSAIIRGSDNQFSSLILGDAAQFSLELKGKTSGGQTPEIIQTDIWFKQRKIKQIREPAVRDLTMRAEPQIIWVETNKPLIESHLNLKSGERAVVGVSRLDGDEKGLILIISAKILP